MGQAVFLVEHLSLENFIPLELFIIHLVHGTGLPHDSRGYWASRGWCVHYCRAHRALAIELFDLVVCGLELVFFHRLVVWAFEAAAIMVDLSVG